VYQWPSLGCILAELRLSKRSRPAQEDRASGGSLELHLGAAPRRGPPRPAFSFPREAENFSPWADLFCWAGFDFSGDTGPLGQRPGGYWTELLIRQGKLSQGSLFWDLGCVAVVYPVVTAMCYGIGIQFQAKPVRLCPSYEA